MIAEHCRQYEILLEPSPRVCGERLKHLAKMFKYLCERLSLPPITRDRRLRRQPSIRSYAERAQAAAQAGPAAPVRQGKRQDGSILAEIQGYCLVRAEGIEPSRPRGLRFFVPLRLSPPRQGRVRGLDYTFTIPLTRFRCCPSSLYTFPDITPGLARDCHCRFPRI